MPTPERKAILVVDDDVELRTALRLGLEEEGFSVDSAGNGLTALEKVREKSPDLVILDLDMPRMGGEQFLYAWRAGVETPGVPVIVITATTEALRPRDLGVEAVFPKPFDVEKLFECVRALLTLPSQAPIIASRTEASLELRGIAEDLSQVTSVQLMTAEQLADASSLPDEVRALATRALDAAHRTAVLVRRLANLVGPPE